MLFLRIFFVIPAKFGVHFDAFLNVNAIPFEEFLGMECNLEKAIRRRYLATTMAKT